MSQKATGAYPKRRKTGPRDYFRYYPWLKIVLSVVALGAILVMMLGVIKNNETGYTSSIDGIDGNGARDVTGGNGVEDGNNDAVVNGVAEENGDKVEGDIGDAVDGNVGEKKLVALTFDDGPSLFTERLLDILKEKGAKVTFFALGSRAAAFPNVIQRAVAEGHEVESHTMNHKNLTELNEVEIASEVTGAENAICGAIKMGSCIKYVRPPYGAVDATVANAILVPMIGWSVDSKDWDFKEAGPTRDRVLLTVFDGAIVLMHDIYESTIEAVPGIIDELRKQGYALVTIDEMVKMREPGLATGVLHRGFWP